MTRDEAIHVIQFAASQLQTSNMRLSERVMQALQVLTAPEDTERVDQGPGNDSIRDSAKSD